MGQILSYKHGKNSVEKVDPRLWDIVQNAIAATPYDAEIRSGAEQRSKRGNNHNHGWAVDVTLIDPKTGKKLPDYQNGEAFSAYEQYAQAARVYQTEKYPELNDTFRWGGYFGSQSGFKGYGAGDLMHLDINPKMGGAMSQGSWEKGAGSALLKAYPGAQTNGGLGGAEGARRVVQYKTALAGSGGLVPPNNIAGPAPTPADMSNRIQTARLGADDAGIGTAFSQLERFGQPGASPVTMSDELAYGSGRVRDVPLPRARPVGPVANVPMPRSRPAPGQTAVAGRPTSPIGSLPPARNQPMVAGRAEYPGSMPAARSGNSPIPIVDPMRSRYDPNGGTPREQALAEVARREAARTVGTGRPSVPGSLPAARPQSSAAPTPAAYSQRPTLPFVTRADERLPARSISPWVVDRRGETASRPQTTITGRPDAPIGSMPAAPRTAISPPPGVFRTAGGIAGTAQMPADYRPNVPQITPPPSVPKTIPNPAFKDTSFTQSPYYTGGAASVPKTIPNPAYRAPAPMPATQSPSLAVQRAAATPTNFIQAGQYTYVKGPNGYERVNAPTPATQSAGLAVSRNVLSPPRATVRAGSGGGSGSGSSGTRVTNSSGTGAFGTSSSGRKYNADTNRWEYA